MPTSTRFGIESGANQMIGGIPTIHYLDLASRGRGQVVRLLWIDAGIAFDDVRYSQDEYPEYKKTKIAELNPNATVPVVELGGKILIQSYAMLRRFARQLGRYDGETEDEKYWTDAMCDVANDWRMQFVRAFRGPNKDIEYPKHQETTQQKYLRTLQTHLSSNDLSSRGSFVLGKRITYADLVIYQICHDEDLTQNDRLGLKQYPRLLQLVEAVEARENVRRFLDSTEYKG